ncbi:smoothelin-like protein 2 [Scyliorhinus canicula]|uniref:smoothelin-like protein 2 n=1 Tax=Scyliorhinus canicula TaxID=7830 RepID=UPI0018F3227F|nr:smoothelin-like protein 2 [Scyliorhinus canicula]
MERNSEAFEPAVEDSGVAAESPDTCCRGDAECCPTNDDTNELAKELQELGTTPGHGEGQEDGETGRDTDSRVSDGKSGLVPGGETSHGTPPSVRGGADSEGDNSMAALEAVSPGTPGKGDSSLAVEGEVGMAASLSMTSLSRSITKEDITCLKSPVLDEVKQPERGRDIGRSQTVPRSFGAQSKRAAAAQKFEKPSTSNEESAGAKVKVHRSTSSGSSDAISIKQRLLNWCRAKTKGYEFVDIQNFSSSWSDGMAFCALVHKFFPESFDYSSLNPKTRRQNFELAFSTAESRADCFPLIEVDDMVRMGRRPDPKCVFTYVQSLCHHLRKLEPEAKAAPVRETT